MGYLYNNIGSFIKKINSIDSAPHTNHNHLTKLLDEVSKYINYPPDLVDLMGNPMPMPRTKVYLSKARIYDSSLMDLIVKAVLRDLDNDLPDNVFCTGCGKLMEPDETVECDDCTQKSMERALEC